MTTSTESLTFRHNPLQDAKSHIRLLKVVSVDDTHPIPVHCELTAFPIAEAPPYRAISYTWGDPVPLASILVNGKPMWVRVNCEYALRQASQHEDDQIEGGFVWIDSICVNQLDNVEKGSQVAMMGEIFKGASRVLACVGGHQDDSEFLYEFLRGKEARIRPFLQSGIPRNFHGGVDVRSELFVNERFAWRWMHSRSFLLRLCEAVSHFLARPYFNRVWIYQELSLGADIKICCGKEELPITWLWVTTLIIQSWLFRIADDLLFMKPRAWSRVWSMIREALPLIQAGAEQGSLVPLKEAIEHVGVLSCEDARDRIYGILSIVEPVQGFHFQPDYTKDRMDLAVEVLQKAAAGLWGHTHDFGTLTDIAHTIGLNLRLSDKPSQNLLAAMKLRCSSTIPQSLEVNAGKLRDEPDHMGWWNFYGRQICCQEDKWTFSNQHKWRYISGLQHRPPRLTKRIKTDEVREFIGDIHLPIEAENGDWLLVPHSSLWSSRTYGPGRVAFQARQCGSGLFEIVGMALITKWSPRWDKEFEKAASRFKFYCDLDDLLALYGLCGWDYLWSIKNSLPLDVFFQPRFCGQRRSSYAVRMAN